MRPALSENRSGGLWACAAEFTSGGRFENRSGGVWDRAAEFASGGGRPGQQSPTGLPQGVFESQGGPSCLEMCVCVCGWG